jgi:hypothetical protein
MQSFDRLALVLRFSVAPPRALTRLILSFGEPEIRDSKAWG